MTWRCFLAAAAIVLLLPASASAKQVTKVLVIGADGRSVNLGSGWLLYGQIRPPNGTATAAPSGSYLLPYPLMESGLPMEPGRYYPASHVGCWSWSLALDGCISVERLPSTWSRTRGLRSFSVEPTTLRTLSHAGARYTVPSNGSVAIDLALLRARLARPAPRAGCTWSFDAEWQGPAASTRPRSLCLRIHGVSAGGGLYPMSPSVTQMLHTVG